MKCSWKNSCVRIISFLYCTIRITKEYKWFFCRRSIFLYKKHTLILDGCRSCILFLRGDEKVQKIYMKNFFHFSSLLLHFVRLSKGMLLLLMVVRTNHQTIYCAITFISASASLILCFSYCWLMPLPIIYRVSLRCLGYKWWKFPFP